MNHLNRRTRYIVLLILAAVLFSVSGCNNKEKEMVLSKYDGPYSAVNGSYGGVDDLGRELLTDTRMQVGEIAEQCGFRDRCYFSRSFAARYGVSPLKFRKNTNSMPGFLKPDDPSDTGTPYEAQEYGNNKVSWKDFS